MPGSAIGLFTEATKTPANNLSCINSPGNKRLQKTFVESMVGGASYVTTSDRSTNDQQGKIVSTGVNTDIAIEGNGMVVVADHPDGEKVFTRRIDLRQDQLGFLKNGADKVFFAWKLDKKGNVPQNASLLTSLEPVNLANTKGDPNATRFISVSMNLDANQEAIKGAGPGFKMQRTGLNSTTALSNVNDLLIPEVTSSGSLQLGDTYEIQSIPPSIKRKLEFGGMTVGRSPSPNRPVLGATNTTSDFSLMPEGGTLKITVGGASAQTYTFTCKKGSPNTSDKEFNNVATLAAAINKISAFNAKADRNGNIHIGTSDPDASISFVDGNGSTLAKELGLYDVAPADNVKRFNSLATLQKAVNAEQNNVKLKAKITNGDIDITSLSATDNFQMTTMSLGKHRIRHASLGDGTVKGAGTVTISAPNNGLKVGDYVRLENTNNIGTKLPDGVYYVSASTSQDFQVSILVDDPAAAAVDGNAGIGAPTDGYPVAAGNAANSHMIAPAIDIINSKADNNASPTWTKVAGRVGSQNTAAAITAAAAGSATINVGAGFTAAVDDVVYVSGAGGYAQGGNTINIPDGYYRVSATGAGTINIAYKNLVAVAPPAGTPSQLSVTNIGHKDAGAAFGANSITTAVFETTATNAQDNSVRVHIPHNNYSVDDYIAFTGLPDNYVIDGASIKNDTKYKIIARGADYVDIEALDANNNALAVGAIAGGVKATYQAHGNAAFTAPDVTAAFGINYFSRALEFFNSSPATEAAQNRTLTETFEKSYDKDNEAKSLSSGKFKTGVFTQTVQGFDSLGAKYDLLMHFAKLEDGKWAVEVSGIPDETDNKVTFNVKALDKDRNDGFIQGGIITFDQNGNFLTAEGVDQPITFTTGNGSENVNLTLDWLNTEGAIKNGTVTQFAKDNNFEFVQQDGLAAGVLTGISITETGIIVGTYDSGETRDLYQIPIATFANINGLVAGAGGTFKASRDSGNLLLKTAGSNGAGKTIGGATESSNVDTTDELLQAKDLATQTQTVARMEGIKISNEKTILAETNV